MSPPAVEHCYLVALGSNMRHARIGGPEQVLRAAIAALDGGGLGLAGSSRILRAAPLGPSRRRFANAVALVRTALEPPGLLGHLQAMERRFGRQRRGRAWGPRVLDLDIVLWSGGCWASRDVVVPHPRFRARHFVLAPALAVAAGWRDPLTGLALRHLHARLTRPRGVPN